MLIEKCGAGLGGEFGARPVLALHHGNNLSYPCISGKEGCPLKHRDKEALSLGCTHGVRFCHLFPRSFNGWTRRKRARKAKPHLAKSLQRKLALRPDALRVRQDTMQRKPGFHPIDPVFQDIYGLERLWNVHHVSPVLVAWFINTAVAQWTKI